MGQVTTVSQIHAHQSVTGLQQSHLNSHVGLSAGVGLHVDIGAVEDLLGALDGDVLNNVHLLAAAVVAGTGITLGILVGQSGALSHLNGLAGEVLGSDQLNVSLLTVDFTLNGGSDLGVLLLDQIEFKRHSKFSFINYGNHSVIRYNCGKSFIPLRLIL